MNKKPPQSNTKSVRSLTFERSAVDVDSRSVELSFSSEIAYPRPYGIEILSHEPNAVDLGRLSQRAAVLVNHDPNQQVGVVESAYIGKDLRGHAVIRFGRSEQADAIYNDVVEGIRSLVSVGYMINSIVLESDTDGEAVYRVTNWTPYEISIVSVPADTTVGVGRSATKTVNGAENVADDDGDNDPENDTENEPEDDDDAEVVIEIKTEKPRAAKSAMSAAQDTKVQTTVTDNTAILQAERERAKSIQSLGVRLDCAELAERAVAEGMSLDAFVTQYNEKSGPAKALRVAETPEIGMTDKEVRRYSFMNAIRAQMEPSNTGFQKDAAFEREVSTAATAKLGTTGTGGFMVPYDVLMGGQRTLTVGSAPQGGNTVQTELHGELFINMFRNKLAVAKLGATMIGGLNGNFSIPRQNGAATTYWIAEAAAPATSNQSFDQVAMTPKTVGAFTDYSRLLLLQSSVDIESVVRSDIAAQLALAVDLAATSGSGASGQPLGVLNASGIGTVVGGTNGAQPTFANMVALETAVAGANADVENMAYLTNAKARGFLKGLPRLGNTSGMPTWDLDNTMNGYNAVVSNQITGTGTKGTANGVCSTILFGNFADMIIGMWGALELKVDPYANSTTGSVRVIGLQSVDVGIRHVASFAAMTDALCG